MSTSATADYAKVVTFDAVALPNTTAQITRKTNLITDTNFANSGGYETRLPGLGEWGVNGKGFIGRTQGYKVLIKKGGTPTTITDEPGVVVSGAIVHVTDAAKRVLSEGTTVSVTDGGSPTTISSINYATGRITLSTPPSSTILVTGKYIPMAVIAEANKYSLAIKSAVLDATDFATAQGNGGTRIHKPGIIDISGTLGKLWTSADGTLEALVIAGTALFIEISPMNGDLITRGWYTFGQDTIEGAVNGLEMETLNFSLTGGNLTNFGFLAGTSLNTGISGLVTKLFSRAAGTFIVKPDGTNGRSGSGFVTEFSIDGDINGVDSFNFAGVSAGALSTVP